ncbi:amino acid permease [Streptosporangium canum]|uniref:amino acid permease n=1 Tax=Streptosporangium canum TaxID=324952 RepID=UPI0036CDE79B
METPVFRRGEEAKRSGLTSASAAARAIGGDYLKTFVTVPGVIVGIVFIVAIALLNYRGVSESVKTNIVFTIIELTGLLVIIVIGVYAVVTGAGEPP